MAKESSGQNRPSKSKKSPSSGTLIADPSVIGSDASSRTKTAIVLKPAKGSDPDLGNFKFDKDRIVIGSVESADVKLTGYGISPIHAVMERHKDEGSEHSTFTLFDLGSRSGVFVNDKKIVAHVLKAKDKITIGKFVLVFSPETFDPKTLREQTRQSEGRTLFLDPQEDLRPLLLEEERFVEPIFNFRPDDKKALEVVMSWCGTILRVEHFVGLTAVTMGHAQKNDFGIPPLLTSESHSVVTHNNGGYVLSLDPKMKGVIQHSGKLESVEDIKGRGAVGSQGYDIHFAENDFAKIEIDDIEFYFSFTAAPPKLKRQRLFEKDPFFQKMLGVSLLFSSIFLYLLWTMPVVNNIEAEKMPERIATILYQPEKFMRPKPPKIVRKKEPEVAKKEEVVIKKPPAVKKIQVTQKAKPSNKPLPKTMAYHSSAPKDAPKVKSPPKGGAKTRPAPKAAAKEGEGARAKGASGTRGEKSAHVGSVHSTRLDRPSPNAGDKGSVSSSKVSDEGNVDLLGGGSGQIQNILGGSGVHLGEGSQNLKGFGNFGTRGSGGLALSGKGAGGGGSAETTLGGLGKKGSGMGRVGTGKGAVGHGSGIVGSSMRVDIRSDGPEEAIVMGAVDRNAVAEAIYAHRDEFRLCYEREINADTPNLSGTVATSFVIGASGRVSRAGIDKSSLHNTNTERCVIKVIKRIQFPVPQGGGVVEVKYPFKFSTASH